MQHTVAALLARLPAALASWFGGMALPETRRALSSERRREADEVRAMASACQHTDPGFAADLYAAAARHEGLTAD